MRVGIFDSGVGGLESLAKFRQLRPDVEALYYADRENAPYGPKSESELIRLVINDIERLTSLGAECVLMACCTASTVYEMLPKRCREISIPIILPTAIAACLKTKSGRIGVLSTEATRKSRAFCKAIGAVCPDAEVIAYSAPELVTLAESGFKDTNLSSSAYRTVRSAAERFLGSDIDTLVLGCTHFSYFEKTLSETLGVNTVNSAAVGAEALSLRIDEDARRRRTGSINSIKG